MASGLAGDRGKESGEVSAEEGRDGISSVGFGGDDFEGLFKGCGGFHKNGALFWESLSQASSHVGVYLGAAELWKPPCSGQSG